LDLERASRVYGISQDITLVGSDWKANEISLSLIWFKCGCCIWNV